MCIRDSRYTAADAKAFILALTRRLALDTQYVQTGYEDTCCLLYTSDAADERSSVDLGGRRIIKKKTIKEKKMHNMTTKKSKHNTTTWHSTK